MENASKALIIAGSILLSILIISLGIIIFRQASGVVSSNSMDEAEVAAFNEKFLQFEGTNVQGAQVNALLNRVINNNITQANSGDTSRQISVTVSANNWIRDSGGHPYSVYSYIFKSTSESGKAQVGKTYLVTCSTTGSKIGLITSITIDDP